jgi:hypothetical protein
MNDENLIVLTFYATPTHLNINLLNVIMLWSLVAPDDGQLAGRNICRAWFFKTIFVLINSACVGAVLLVLINMHGENNIK